jgi:hypothetical protein
MNLAESAGVEPAQPFGLVALAPRCLAARPTLLSLAIARTLRSAQREAGWLGRQGSNLQPAESESAAPPIAPLPNARRDEARRVDHALIAHIIVPLAAVEAAGAQAALLESAVPSRTGTSRCARVSRSAPCRRARRARRAAPAFPRHNPRLRLREVSKGREVVEVAASHGRLLWFGLEQTQPSAAEASEGILLRGSREY